MNNTALAVIQPDELDVIQRTAKLLAASGYFGNSAGVTGIAEVATKILAGRELGFGPFAAVNGIHIIQGKPAVGANLLAAAVRSHPRYDYRVKELTDTVCELEFIDNGKPSGNSRFTIEDAKAAELSTGKNAATWRKYGRNMLFARAMSNGVRWYAPDIFSGNAVYVPEELGATVNGDGDVIDVTPRRVDKETGEIVDTSSENVDEHEANPFDDPTPHYRHVWNKLVGDVYDFVGQMAMLHDSSGERCTARQYQYLAGLVDALTDNQHNYMLSLLCQSEISGDNLPGRKLVAHLFDVLPERIKQKGADGKEIAGEDGKPVMIPNPNYRRDICELIATIARPIPA